MRRSWNGTRGRSCASVGRPRAMSMMPRMRFRPRFSCWPPRPRACECANHLVRGFRLLRIACPRARGPWRWLEPLASCARNPCCGAAIGFRERAEISSILHEEIDRLPERYRLPLLLCDIENCTQQEAARKLGWPLGTVKSRQARARARLRARLVRRGLHGVVPPVGVIGAAHPTVAESLIHSTARAATGLLARGESVRSLPGSVASLVKYFLRTTIVTRLTSAIGVVCLITAGIAATVMAQGQTERKKGAPDSVPASVVERKVQAAALRPSSSMRFGSGRTAYRSRRP